MIILTRKHDRSDQAWAIGRGHAHDGDDSTLRFPDRESALDWLHGFEIDDLRRLVQQREDNAPLPRLTDHDVLGRVADLLHDGVLRARRIDGEDWRGENWATGADPGAGVASRLARRLERTSRVFTFGGDRLRIVTARRWQSLRDFGDGSYRPVERELAQATLNRISQWVDISPDERRAVAQAVPLVADTGHLHQPRLADGIVLLQVVTRIGAIGPTRREAAVTPSQLAARRTEEELHWIAIELLDAADRPVPHQAYRVKLPDGATREGHLDKNGQARIDHIRSAGPCQVCFPEIDAKEWGLA